MSAPLAVHAAGMLILLTIFILEEAVQGPRDLGRQYVICFQCLGS